MSFLSQDPCKRRAAMSELKPGTEHPYEFEIKVKTDDDKTQNILKTSRLPDSFTYIDEVERMGEDYGLLLSPGIDTIFGDCHVIEKLRKLGYNPKSYISGCLRILLPSGSIMCCTAIGILKRDLSEGTGLCYFYHIL